ncbi:SH3 domain-containing protein [Rhizobium herbae]
MRAEFCSAQVSRNHWRLGWLWHHAMFCVLLTLSISASEAAAFSMPANAKAPLGWRTGRETGLPVPRFVSLKAQSARMRIGPSFANSVKWLYTAPGLPMEIIEEYGNWRQVRDCDGISGWMHRSLLSARRTAIIGPWKVKSAALYAGASQSSGIAALLAPRVRLQIRSCKDRWCSVSVSKHKVSGFIDRSHLWGVYPSEVISN